VIRAAWYRRLPIPLQNVVCSVAGAQRVSAGGRRWAAQSRDRSVKQQHSDEDVGVVTSRDARLREFVTHAGRTVPYYQRLFAELAFDPQDVTSLDDMRHLPILNARVVERDPGAFISSVARRADYRRQWGESGTLPWSRAAQEETEQVRARFRRDHGIVDGTWCSYFGGVNVVPIGQAKPPFWRIDWPGRRVLFSPYHLSEQTIESFVDALNHFQCPWIQGSPVVLATLAGLMSASRLAAEYPVTWVTTEGGLPQSVQQRSIRRVFGAKPIRLFIAPCAVASISERSDGALVVDDDYAAVELLPGPEVGTFRVIGTNLANAVAPLLRYDTGLVVHLAGSSNLTIGCREVASWEDPSRNVITLPSGSRIGRLERMFDDMPQVLAVQLFQYADLTIDIDVRMAWGYTKADADAVQDRVAARFGTAAFRINYVNSMPLMAGGKVQVIHSEAGDVNRTVVEPNARYVWIQ
jgi:phenylacetate-CoA ligase